MKEKLSYKELETFKLFMRITINEISNPLYSLDYIKFVFKEEDIKDIEDYLDLDIDNYKNALEYLKSNLDGYNNRKEGDNNLYIYVDDIKRFFALLTRIKSKTSFKILKSIWLRMNVYDLNNVNDFLKKELDFLNPSILKGIPSDLGMYYNCDLTYEDENNPDFFETNKHIKFTLHKDNKIHELPVVHYAIRSEDDKNICYIYGIQNMDGTIKSDDIKEELKEYRKALRNGKVSPEMVMSLELFLELLKVKDITNIRVPLLQIFNYDYHERLSINHKNKYDEYTDSEKEKYDNMNIEDAQDEKLFDYLFTKECNERFVDKQDIISKNKTERLVDIFMVMEEKYHNIEFLNDPFIEDENLNIKILEK